MEIKDFRFEVAEFAAGEGSDFKKGLIRGVSVITLGEAKGHGVFVDARTLDTVELCVPAGRRVKVKLNHWSGVGDIIGYAESFRRDGERTRMDLQLNPDDARFRNLMWVIQTMPAEVGMSISFRGFSESDPVNPDRYLVRCTELSSVDLVDDPAANRTGMFSRGVDTPGAGMVITSLEQFDAATKGLDLQALSAKSREIFGQALAAVKTAREEKTAVEGQLSTVTTERDKLRVDLGTMTADRDKLKGEAKTAEEKANEMLSARGIKPLSQTGGKPGEEGEGEGEPDVLKQFEALKGEAQFEFFQKNKEAIFKAQQG